MLWSGLLGFFIQISTSVLLLCLYCFIYLDLQRKYHWWDAVRILLLGLDSMVGRCKWKPTGRVGIRPHSELENNPTLWGREDTIYEKEMQWFLQTEQSIKRLSLCVNMEIGQCSARVLWDTLIMNRKWERQSREEIFFCLFLSLMSVTMTLGHVFVGNESDTLWYVWWKYNEE